MIDRKSYNIIDWYLIEITKWTPSKMYVYLKI